MKHRNKTQIPTSLISIVAEECNRIELEKTNMIDVLVFSDTLENSIRVRVEKPGISDYESFSEKMDRIILEKIRWCVAA